MPPQPRIPHAVPWGDDAVLVSAPLGTRLLCPTEDLSIAPELALTGVYDAPFVSFLQRRLRRGMTFVDVGANVGLFSILAAACVGSGGRVFAFECNPVVCEFLRRNVAMNWFEDRVRLIAKAAHQDNTVRILRVPREYNGLGSITRFVEADDLGSDFLEYRVECERIDAALADVPYIDLLKIDVEGGEAAAIDGATGLLDENRIGTISLEFRAEVTSQSVWDEAEKMLTSLVRDRGATLHTPGSHREIPLDEALTVFQYPQLLVRFPKSTIDP